MRKAVRVMAVTREGATSRPRAAPEAASASGAMRLLATRTGRSAVLATSPATDPSRARTTRACWCGATTMRSESSTSATRRITLSGRPRST